MVFLLSLSLHFVFFHEHSSILILWKIILDQVQSILPLLWGFPEQRGFKSQTGSTSYTAEGGRKEGEDATDSEWGGLRRESRRLVFRSVLNHLVCRSQIQPWLKATVNVTAGSVRGFLILAGRAVATLQEGSSLICTHGITFSPFLGHKTQKRTWVAFTMAVHKTQAVLPARSYFLNANETRDPWIQPFQVLLLP